MGHRTQKQCIKVNGQTFSVFPFIAFWILRPMEGHDLGSQSWLSYLFHRVSVRERRTFILIWMLGLGFGEGTEGCGGTGDRTEAETAEAGGDGRDGEAGICSCGCGRFSDGLGSNGNSMPLVTGASETESMGAVDVACEAGWTGAFRGSRLKSVCMVLVSGEGAGCC